jgi:ABC-2 type transport system permease protein
MTRRSSSRGRQLRGGDLTRTPTERKELKVIYVVAEGEGTEYDYLNRIDRAYGRQLGFRIKTPNPVTQRNGLHPRRVVEEAIQVVAKPDIDQVWALFDHDGRSDVPQVCALARRVGTGLPAGGSLLLGAATACVGLVFAALTAVMAQVFENARGAYGAVALALGAASLLRAAGDVSNAALSWLSPIGWAQRTFPYSANRWWPLLLLLASAAALVAVAVALLDRRDFGAGLVPPRLGRPAASRALASPLGLAWRLQRGSLIGWGIGVFLLAAAYGSFGDSIEEYVADNPEVADYLPGGAADVVDSYLALTILMAALITMAFGVASVMRARGEESAGHAEPVLATAASRAAWLGSHLSVALGGSALLLAAAGFGEGLAYGLTVSDAGQIPRLMGVALVYLPAVWLVIGLAVLGFGWLPRAAAALAWAIVGYCAVVALFALSFDLPGWLRGASPFTHTPDAPLDSVTAAPLLTIGAVVAALLAFGLFGFRRRDIPY